MDTHHPISTEDFIITLFCRVDDALGDVPRHRQALLWPSEIVALAILFALKGVGERRFYRWLQRDWRALFPRLPERTRLFRLFATHQDWVRRFLADPTVLGVADTFGVELIHPRREHRSPRQIGKKGLSNHRWIVGGKLCVVLNQRGLVCDWDCGTANVADNSFQPLIQRFDQQMIVLTDSSFHRAEGDAPNVKICRPHTWKERWVVETVLSLFAGVCQLKKLAHRQWPYFRAHLGWAVVAYNLLVQWHGLPPDPNGVIHQSIAEFAL